MLATPMNRLQKLWYQHSAQSLSYVAGSLVISSLATIFRILFINGGHIRILLLRTLLWKEIDSTEVHQAMSVIQSVLQAIEGWWTFLWAICFVTSAYWGATLLLAHTRRKSGLKVVSFWPLKPRFSFFVLFISIAILKAIIDEKVFVLTADNAIAADFLYTVLSLGHKPSHQQMDILSMTLLAIFAVIFAVLYFALAWVIGKLGRKVGFY
jgi:hypothetical protein